MAEEVKIVDVAGGPAAEATLQELVKVMKAMAAKSGTGSGAAAEAQKQYNESVKKGTTVKKDNTKAAEENTSALNKMSNAVGRLVGGVISGFTSIIGYGISVATNLFKAFGDGTGTLTDMISQVPLFGSVLAMLTAPFDNTLQAFQSLATSGASFNNSLTDLRASAAGAKVSLDTFVSFISANTEKFATFGGTVTQGAEAFGRARRAMRAYEQDLLNMGLSFEEINESLADYMFMNRAGSRAQGRDMAQLAQHSASYTQNLMTLSKLTGQDVKAQREKLAAQQADIAFQMRLARLSPEERAKVQEGLAEAMAAGGETGALFFKQQFLGIPPLTRATQMFAATMPEAAAAIQRMHEEATQSGTSLAQFRSGQVSRLADFVEGAATAGENLESVLAAASGGLEGPASEIAEIFRQQGKQMTDYIRFENGRQVFDREAFERDVRAAQNELNERDSLVEGLTGFQNTLRNIREAIELNIIGPIGKALGPQLTRLAEMFKNTNEGTLTPAIEKIGDMIQQFSSDIQTFGFTGALQNLLTNIGQAAKPVFDSMIDSIKSMLFGQSAEEVREGLQTTRESLSANAADIQAQIDALNTELPTLSGASAESARAQIAALEAQLGRVNTRIQETDTELENATGTSGLFGGIFGDLWNKVKEMDWGTIALSLAGLTAAIVALGFAAKPVVLPLLAIGAAAAGIGLAGEGLAALINSITGSIDRLAAGLERMQALDAEKLLNVGQNLGPLTDNLMGLAAGGILASFIGEGTFENLANGLTALAGVNSAGLIETGTAITNIKDPLLSIAGSGLLLNFVGDNVFGNLADQLKRFEDLNPEALHQIGPALISLNQGIQAFTGGGVLESIGNAIGNFFSGLFGGNEFEDLVENLRRFETVDTRKIYEIGQGLQGIANFSDVDIGDIRIGTRDLESLSRITAALDSTPITTYSTALEKLVDVLEDLNGELGNFTTPVTGQIPSTGRTSPAGTLAGIGGSDQQLIKLDQLNTTMMMILTELQDNTEFNRRISRSVRGNNLQA